MNLTKACHCEAREARRGNLPQEWVRRLREIASSRCRAPRNDRPGWARSQRALAQTYERVHLLDVRHDAVQDQVGVSYGCVSCSTHEEAHGKRNPALHEIPRCVHIFGVVQQREFAGTAARSQPFSPSRDVNHSRCFQIGSGGVFVSGLRPSSVWSNAVRIYDDLRRTNRDFFRQGAIQNHEYRESAHWLCWSLRMATP